MTRLLIACASLLAAMLSGCSAPQAYTSLQDLARDQCQRLPEVDRAGCLRRSQADYDTYQKQRAEMRK